ncbi:MAG: hypothetical protein JW720_16260 [Sedimentisphaerales bacterium]|nr:hypothetical protein [Sedimentisphaerales bacterium]
MKMTTARLKVLLVLPVLLVLGCEAPAPGDPDSPGNGSTTPTCVLYAPARVDIMPITEIVVPKGNGGEQVIAYVSLLDSYGSEVKSPAKFRFELYEQVERSAEPKGRRLEIWPEIDISDPNDNAAYWFDLSAPAENNKHWRNYIRAYCFTLPLKTPPGKDCILEVTCQSPNGRRLTSETALKGR